jgi:hypothetical protein
MDEKTVNLRVLTEQFLLWWGIYYAFLMAVFTMPMRISAGEVTPIVHDILLTAECTALASLMAIIHYYFLFRRYAMQKKYPMYFITTLGLITVFILIDFMLFRFQIGEYFFLHNTPEHLLVVNCERVFVAYLPLVIVYTLVRRARERKMGA